MSLIATRKELIEFFQNQTNRRYIYDRVARQSYDSYTHPATAERAVEVVREAVTHGRFLGKSLRPWFVVPPAQRLDGDKVWVGFEFETGYRTTAQRLEAIQWFDRYINRGCFDQEGSGQAPVEFTFYPVELDEIDDCGVLKLIKHGRSNAPASHAPSSYVGTHLNISTPNTRNGLWINTQVFRTALTLLTNEERMTLFGRDQLYSGVLHQHPTHYEFKMFNTTYDEVRWAAYCVTTRKVVEIIEWMETNRDAITQGYNTLPSSDPTSPYRVVVDKLREAIPEIKALIEPKAKPAAKPNRAGPDITLANAA